MNSKTVNKGDREKGNECVWRKNHQNLTQKPFVFPNISKPSPQLSDKNEFPSLNEISEKTSPISHTAGGISKYSDKVKLHSASDHQNQKTVTNYFHYKNESLDADTFNEPSFSTPCYQYTNAWSHSKGNKNLNEKVISGTNEPGKSSFVNKKITAVNFSQNIPQTQSSHPSEEFRTSKNDTRIQSSKKDFVNTSSSKFHNKPSTSAFKNESFTTNSPKELDHNRSCYQYSNKWSDCGNKSNVSEKRVFAPNEFGRSPLKKEKIPVNISSNIPESESNNSFRVSHSLNHHERNIQSPKLKHPVNATNSHLHTTNSKSAINPNCSSSSSMSNIQTRSNREIKIDVKNSPMKEKKNDASNVMASPKKKKRKSKVKRQVALQTGKITVLTPEVHSKILNQTTGQPVISQKCRNVLTDINDEQEYPELGRSAVPASQKENYPKKETKLAEPAQDTTVKNIDISTEEQLIPKNDSKECVLLSVLKSDEKAVLEKKGKIENKAVRPNDPITVSFYDMIVNKSCKTKMKDYKVEVDTPVSLGQMKMKDKKNSSHPHNLLDSSSPAVKRGKEKEKPKAKKPSLIKKIILIDRQMRKERLLQLKCNLEENTTTGSEPKQEVNAFEDDQTDCKGANIVSGNNLSPEESFQNEDEEKDNLILPGDSGKTLHDDCISNMKIMNVSAISDEQKTEKELFDVPFITSSAETIKSKHFTEQGDINLTLEKLSVEENEISKSEIITDFPTTSEDNSNVIKLPHTVFERYIGYDKLEPSDKEKAVKILLHTRNFREYCNHLVSEDIDCSVFALLDDLARFQDRLHQKDPIKARMKRRMIYGVREVKKHVMLNKLKCIIVAADIENIETHGGLNDLLNDLKWAAADHHIPCVFALSRKRLGKVCRKPVPVSCVGIFNYEGSEANFKKMMALQTQSKMDYTEITSKLSQTVTEEQVAILLKAKTEAPETLRAIREDILSEFFLERKTDSVECDKTDHRMESE